MAYSLDLRERVVRFVNSGGSKSEASRRYEVGRDTVYRWLSAETLQFKQSVRRNRKLDINLLINRVKDFPEARLIDHAEVFNVHINAIWYQFKKLGITYKKNSTLQGKKASGAYSLPPNLT